MEVNPQTINELVCVEDLQRSISFERILTPTCVPSDFNAYPRLTLPAWFVRQHGDKLGLSVVLQNETTRERWTVQVVIRHPLKNPQVMFYGGGWKVFAGFNGLVEGDRLIFTLTAMSEFEVCISDNAGELAVPWPRKFSKKTRRSQRLTGGFPNCKIGNATVKIRKSNAVPGLRKLRSVTCTPEEEVADSASSGTSPCNSSFSKLPLSRITQVSPLGSFHGADDITEPGALVVYRQQLVTSSNRSSSPRNSREGKRTHAHAIEYWDDVPRKKLQTSLPRFVKRLPVSHCQRMEIPRDFLKIYGDRLHTPLKLQGIHDGSPARAVACCWRNDGKFYRLDLTDGWKAFNTENCLEAGQKFVFTLAADSFFQVRRVYE